MGCCTNCDVFAGLAKLTGLGRFLIKCFKTEAVVFDTTSGDTHYLSRLAYTLLTTRQTHPDESSYQDIFTAVAVSLDMEPNGEFRLLFDEAILSLQNIGLLGET